MTFQQQRLLSILSRNHSSRSKTLTQSLSRSLHPSLRSQFLPRMSQSWHRSFSAYPPFPKNPPKKALTKISEIIEDASDAGEQISNLDENPENSMMELMAVVFSLHPDVQTKVYPITSSPIAEEVQLASTPLPESAIPSHMTDKHKLLKHCQKLLYKIYYHEMGWRPSTKAHTQFKIREEEKLFCDRYDETAIWTVVLDPARSEVASCTRILSAKLSPKGFNEAQQPDLDILGYSGCTESFRDWVQAKGGAQRVFEAQRFALAPKYRGKLLPYLMFHASTLAYMDDSKSPLYDPDAVFVIASPVHLRRYMIAAGGIHDQNWTVRYEKRDPKGPIPIFTLVLGGIIPSIEAFLNARIEKQREAFSRSLNDTALTMTAKDEMTNPVARNAYK